MIIISSASAEELNTAEDLTINEDLSIDNGDSINLDEELMEDNAIFTENEELEVDNEQSDNSKGTLSDYNSITVTNKTFSGIQEVIDSANENDTIILEGFYTNDLEEKSIIVNKSLSFLGKNDAILDYTNEFTFSNPIFNISAYNVTLGNITFQNANSGGAIYSNGTTYLTINDCSFLNNHANDGGAIWTNASSSVWHETNHNIGSYLTINNCTFFNNSANSGGAIWTNNSLVSIAYSSFKNCSASSNGGAMRIENIIPLASIRNCDFMECSAIYGGAICTGETFYWWVQQMFDLNISNCNFKDNLAIRVGSTLYSYANHTNLIGCTFTNNSCNYSEGVVYVRNLSSIKVSNCNLNVDSDIFLGENNSITFIPVNASDIQSCVNFAGANDTIILNGTFVLDHAIDINKDLYFIGINDATVTKYSQYHYQLFSSSSSWRNFIVHFKNITFSETKGGLMFNICIDVDNCTFLHNWATYPGGFSSSLFSSMGCSIINNSYFDGNNGDFLIGGSSNGDYPQLTIDNCNFFNHNDTLIADSLLHWGGVKITNSNFINSSDRVQFIGNSASGSGLIYSQNRVFIENCTFENNYESQNLGIINCHDYEKLTIINCKFNNNTALKGGIIYSEIGSSFNTQIINSTFTNNKVSNNSGVLKIVGIRERYSSDFSGFIENCSFINTNEGVNSSVIYLDNLTEVSISNCEFINSSSANNGGAIYLNNSNNVSISDCEFIHCFANGIGGAICTDESSYNVSILKNRFINNSAAFGGAICCLAENATISNCSFNENHASECGGAIFVNQSTNLIRLSYNNFTNNIIANDDPTGDERCGGAIYFLAKKAIMYNSTFTSNIAIDAGGAVYVNEDTTSIAVSGCKFLNNSISGDFTGEHSGGGAVCSVSNGLTIDKCIFNSNFAPDSWGGAIRLIIVLTTTGSKNLLGSSNNLGASSATVVKNTVFYNNTAFKGKAVYTSEESKLILNTFMKRPDESMEDMVYGLSAEQLMEDYYNVYTESKLNSTLNATNRTLVFDDPIIIPISSDNVESVNVTIIDDNNKVVYEMQVVSNGEFIVPSLAAGTYTVKYISNVLEDMFNPSSAESKLIINKAKSTIGASNVSTYYGKTFSIKPSYDNASSIKYVIKNSAGNQVKSGTISPGASITGLSFASGTYTLTLTAVVDSNHTGSSSTSKITVNKATGNITASALTTYYSSGKTWSITLKDKTNNKVLASKKLTLKVYTGSKYKTYTVTTNSKGVATFKASTLAPGSHKVIVSYSNSNYSTKSLTKTIKINKMALTYKVSKSTQKDGAGLHIWVKNKATGKTVNKIKIKVLVYTGKKYKTITLVSAKYSTKGNGYTGYAVKGPVYSIGTHTVKIMAGDSYHSGSVKSSLVLKSSVKKYTKKIIIISKGKRTVKKA